MGAAPDIGGRPPINLLTFFFLFLSSHTSNLTGFHGQTRTRTFVSGVIVFDFVSEDVYKNGNVLVFTDCFRLSPYTQVSSQQNTNRWKLALINENKEKTDAGRAHQPSFGVRY